MEIKIYSHGGKQIKRNGRHETHDVKPKKKYDGQIN